MALGQQLPPEGPGSGDVTAAVLGSVSGALVPRGYLTTEWWTTILGGALSAVLALVHVGGTTATHVAAVIAPAVLAAFYAITRTMHKSKLASLMCNVFPQALAAGALPAPDAVPVEAPAAAPPPAPAAAAVGVEAMAAPAPEPGPGGEPTGSVAQTDPGFSFQGIPPIEDDAAAEAPEAPPAGAAGEEAMPPAAPDATAAGEPTGSVAQTDPDFSFQGIPPIEDDNG